MKHNILFIAITFIVLLSSCEKVIEFNGEQTKPLLVINGIQHQDKPAKITVSKSQFFLSNTDDYSVSNAHVDLYVNGQFIETLQHKVDTIRTSWSSETTDVYYGQYIFVAGDSVRFEVSAQGFDNVKAGTIIPDMPFIISFDTTRTETTSFGDYSGFSFTSLDQNGDSCYVDYTGDTIWPNDIINGLFYFNLNINDPSQRNYYNLAFIKGFSIPYSNDFVFTSDGLDAIDQIGSSVFGEESSYYLDESNPFTDTYFNGKEYSISFTDNNSTFYNNASVEFKIGLSNVDYNYYQYVKSYRQAEDNDFGNSLIGMFREPTQVYSNVEGGIGIICSESVVSTRSIVIKRRRP